MSVVQIRHPDPSAGESGQIGSIDMHSIDSHFFFLVNVHLSLDLGPNP
jgi:hypothetical protein